MDRATNTFKSTILDSISENTTRNVIELSKTKGNNAVMATISFFCLFAMSVGNII
jgi:hypothetical protein